jgi:hypothetical protein
MEARQQQRIANKQQLAHNHWGTPSLPETWPLPWVQIFAVRLLSGARQRASLPCVSFYNARQRIFAVHFNYRRMAKIFFFLHPCNKRLLVFDVRRLEMRGKEPSLSCVLLRRTTKFFKKLWFCTSFYFSNMETLFCTLYFKFIQGSTNLLFLKIMCHLKNYCRIRQIWTASA